TPSCPEARRRGRRRSPKDAVIQETRLWAVRFLRPECPTNRRSCEVRMATDIEELIQHKWQSEERPLFNGVLFATGEIVLRECLTLRESGASSTSIKVRTLARSTLASYLAYNDEGAWTGITSMGTVDAEQGTVVFGEGSWGGDGFVALCERGGERLTWMAFFQ